MDTPQTIDQSQQSNIELLKLQDNHQYDIACRQIDSTLTNNREARAYLQEKYARSDRNALILGMTTIVLFFGFGFFALWLDKEQLLSDLLKVALGILSGGGFGFYLGAKKTIRLSNRQTPKFSPLLRGAFISPVCLCKRSIE